MFEARHGEERPQSFVFNNKSIDAVEIKASTDLITTETPSQKPKSILKMSTKKMKMPADEAVRKPKSMRTMSAKNMKMSADETVRKPKSMRTMSAGEASGEMGLGSESNAAIDYERLLLRIGSWYEAATPVEKPKSTTAMPTQKMNMPADEASGEMGVISALEAVPDSQNPKLKKNPSKKKKKMSADEAVRKPKSMKTMSSKKMKMASDEAVAKPKSMAKMPTQDMTMSADEASVEIGLVSELEAASHSQEPKLKKKLSTKKKKKMSADEEVRKPKSKKKLSRQKLKMSADEASGEIGLVSELEAASHSQEPKLKKKLSTKKTKMSADEAVRKPKSMKTMSSKKMKKMSADDAVPKPKSMATMPTMPTQDMTISADDASGEIGLVSELESAFQSQEPKSMEIMSTKEMTMSANEAVQKPNSMKAMPSQDMTMSADEPSGEFGLVSASHSQEPKLKKKLSAKKTKVSTDEAVAKPKSKKKMSKQKMKMSADEASGEIGLVSELEAASRSQEPKLKKKLSTKKKKMSADEAMRKPKSMKTMSSENMKMSADEAVPKPKSMATMTTQDMTMSADEPSGEIVLVSEFSAAAHSQEPKLKKKLSTKKEKMSADEAVPKPKSSLKMSKQKMKLSSDEASGEIVLVSELEAASVSQEPKLKKKLSTKKMKMAADEAVRKPKSTSSMSKHKMKMSADEAVENPKSISTKEMMMSADKAVPKPKLKKKLSTQTIKMSADEAVQKPKSKKKMPSKTMTMTADEAAQKPKSMKTMSTQKMTADEGVQKPKSMKAMSTRKLKKNSSKGLEDNSNSQGGEVKKAKKRSAFGRFFKVLFPRKTKAKEVNVTGLDEHAEKMLITEEEEETKLTCMTEQDTNLDDGKRIVEEGGQAQTQEEATLSAEKQIAHEEEEAGMLEAAQEAGLAEECFAEDAQISAPEGAAAASTTGVLLSSVVNKSTAVVPKTKMDEDADPTNRSDVSQPTDTTTAATGSEGPVGEHDILPSDEAPTLAVSSESENKTIIADREEGVSGLDDATPEAAEGHSPLSVFDFVSQDPPMTPTAGDKTKKESPFAGFFKILSPRKTNAKEVDEAEQDELAEKTRITEEESSENTRITAQEEERAGILDAARQAALEAAQEAGLAEEWSAEDAQSLAEQTAAHITEEQRTTEETPVAAIDEDNKEGGDAVGTAAGVASSVAKENTEVEPKTDMGKDAEQPNRNDVSQPTNTTTSSVEYVSQDAPMSPPGQGGDDETRKGSTFAGFFKIRSPRNKNAEKGEEAEPEEHTEKPRLPARLPEEEETKKARIAEASNLIESANGTMRADRGEAVSGIDAAPAPADGRSSLSSVDYVSQDATMGPMRKGPTFAEFFKSRSARNMHAKQLQEAEQNEHAENKAHTAEDEETKQARTSIAEDSNLIESATESMMADREEVMSGVDDAAPEPADGRSSPSPGNHASQDAPMSPPGQGEDEKSTRIGPRTIAGFFQSRSAHNRHAKKVEEAEKDEQAEKTHTAKEETEQARLAEDADLIESPDELMTLAVRKAEMSRIADDFRWVY